MAANFTETPTVVQIKGRDYHVVETAVEDMKKRYYKLSNNPRLQWKLSFHAVTSTVMNNIVAHYDSCYGSYSQFTWTSVPSYIESGSNLTGRWVQGSLNVTPLGKKYWNVDIVFEKSVS